MSDEVWAALAGGLIGVASSYLAMRHASKEAKRQRKHDRREKREDYIRQAYVEWLHAAHVRHMKLASLKVSIDKGYTIDRIGLYADLTNDVIFNASKLKLLDPDQATVTTIDQAIQASYLALGGIIQHQTEEARKGSLEAANKNLKTARNALRRRFTGHDLPGWKDYPTLAESQEKAANDDQGKKES